MIFFKFKAIFDQNRRYKIVIYNKLQVLVDFTFFACLNIHMLDLNRTKYRARNFNTYLNTKTKLRPKGENVHSLMRRLKKKEFLRTI